MRYAYAITAALLAGGASATMVLQQPVGAQVAQNAPGQIQAAAPRPGAPLSFADLAAKLQPAVVNISTTQRVQVQNQNPFAGTPFGDLFGRFGGSGDGQPITREATSLGSGFIVSPDGYVVTNNHVISGGAQGRGIVSSVVDSITVTLPDRSEYKAKVIGRDPYSDLALLKIESKTPLPFVQFGDSTRTRVGDWVVAIGNPFGLGGTVTAGIVSALHRSISGGAYDRYIQTDASINQGNSGGPMFDLSGNVIGINTAIFSPTGGNVGIGFAIPAEQAKPVIEQLKGGGRVKRGYLGVGIQPMSEDIASGLGLPKDRGEIVSRVEPGEAAARAGIRQGDVIVKVNNREVTPDETLSYIVANSPVGTRMPIELIRDGKRMTLTVVVGERPPEDQLAAAAGDDDDGDGSATPAPNAQSTRQSIGLGVQALTPEVARQLGVPTTTRGVVVAQVDPNSDAAQEGIQRGDIILSINQRPVTTVADAAAAVDAARKAGRSTALLFIQRGNGTPRYIGVKINSGSGN
ncbi:MULTISPECIES: Do family serine endopeptidase [Sphingomonadales]|uniref:Probable periplasmic serine endoprotease DegP-like n=2 Tax=Edaphosphingomonas TaxID=3423724 RepID=A0A2T4HT45_9SPHN|nr:MULTISPECIES: Do family serine endopeptidase [Sphingomonas]AGH49672.1 protease Do [Sphingomonas sp. MM-1]OHT22247.1 putative periplasmic serine endoprotease DegP-like precursor [Sphingomonas haloaromaticamans]PTD18983.1 protease [Sphingomonas fennica]